MLMLALPQSCRIHAALTRYGRDIELLRIERFLKAMINPELRVQIDYLLGNAP